LYLPYLFNTFAVTMDRELEIWKPVVGYEGLYEISSYGKLKRLSGYSPRKRNGYIVDNVFHGETILKSYYNHKGYLHNDLYKFINDTKIRKPVLIHRVVGDAFLSKPPKDKVQINHKNGIKDDNYYKNLEWCDNSENQIHARKMGLHPPNKKGFNNIQSVSIMQFSGDKLIKTYGSLGEAERETGIDRTNIKKVCRGKRKMAGGFSWEYV
jgi:hypothetical protein